MKNHFLLFLAFFLSFAAYSNADDFLGAPVVPSGNVTEKTEARLKIMTQLSHNEVLTFYKEALKDLKDIKFRQWKHAVYIEDDGNRQWHSITISEGDEKGTTVIIVKDNWTWIIGTLLLRYIGVFGVLMVLFLGMAVSGKVISGAVKRIEEKRQQDSSGN